MNTRARCALALPALVILTTTCAGTGDRSTAHRTARGQDSAAAARAIRYARERRVDLTGDHVRERVVVTATGPTYDSLNVVLEIQSDDGTPLYTDRWSSARYFSHEPRAGKPDSTVRRIVLSHLQTLLADSAFTPAGSSAPATRIDTAAVEHDLREMTVRAAHALADTIPLTSALDAEVRRTTIRRTSLDSAIAALTGKPRFTYSAGGELTYTIAWYPRMARFVRTQACCWTTTGRSP